MDTTFPLMHTDRFLLRQIVTQDLENVYKGLSHPDVIKYYGVSYTSLEGTKAQMEFFKNLEEQGTGIWWAICTKDTLDFCGTIGFTNLNKEHRKAELGFWLLPEYWQQGIITEVIPTVCNYAFEKLNLHRIEAFVETENKASKNSLHKFNFKHEGTLSECEIKNDAYISLDIYAKLSSE